MVEAGKSRMNNSRIASLLKGTFGTAALLLSPTALFAQCPLCYQAAASSGERFIQALRVGILILLPAPFIFGAVIGFMAYRRRDEYADSPEPSSSADSFLD
jgi:hypothetical protein